MERWPPGEADLLAGWLAALRAVCAAESYPQDVDSVRLLAIRLLTVLGEDGVPCTGGHPNPASQRDGPAHDNAFTRERHRVAKLTLGICHIHIWTPVRLGWPWPTAHLKPDMAWCRVLQLLTGLSPGWPPQLNHRSTRSQPTAASRLHAVQPPASR
jgi:hypothetical protein